MSSGLVLLMLPRWTRDGGVAAHVQASAAALSARGMRVSVLTAHIDPGEAIAGVEVHVSPRLFDREAPIDVRLGDALSGPPDIVHIHQVDDPELIAHVRRSAPVAISAHGYIACTSGVHYFRPGHECDRAHGPGCWPNLLLRGCAHTRHPQTLPASYRQASRGLAALRGADMAIAYSSAMDRHLATNGVDSRAIVPLFSTMAPRTGSGHLGRRRVVFGGRLVAPKGVRVLVRAALEVDGEFVVCGTGWRLESMRTLTRRLGVADRFQFRGWLAPDQLAQELADASVVVVPSVWPEPFGLVGIEALAAGRPVVASATGGIVDWLTDGVTGLAVAPGDADDLARALRELLADPERQRAMGEAGRRMVAERFSEETHVAGLRRAYETARAAWEPAAG